MHFGIDYGSKTSGNTAIAYDKGEQIHILQAEPKKDADQWIKQKVAELQPDKIFIDAPLSLPLVYSTGEGSDYFYRECDRKVKGMSPLFIGGLTARAMKLKSEMEAFGIEVFEIYPKMLARENSDLPHYKTTLAALKMYRQNLTERMPAKISDLPQNWHQLDAVLAWWSGYRYLNSEAVCVGNPEEGMIYY